MSWKSWSLPLGKAETGKFCHLVVIIIIIVNLVNLVMKIINFINIKIIPQNYTSTYKFQNIYLLSVQSHTLTTHRRFLWIRKSRFGT